MDFLGKVRAPNGSLKGTERVSRRAGKLLEGDVDELPDLTEAEQVMERVGMG